MEKKIIAVSTAPKAIGPYSQGVSIEGTGKMYYFSGQLGLNPETGKMEEGLIAQTVRSLKNVDALLSANGMTASNVIKTLVFITNMADFALVNAEYSKYFVGDYPARSCVEVSKLPLGGLVEIEVIAVK